MLYKYSSRKKSSGGKWSQLPKCTKKEKFFRTSLGTRSRGRTGTGVNLLVFETSASTDSAIRAGDSLFESGDKDIKKIRFQQF